MLSPHYAAACPEGTEETYSVKYGRNICYPDAQTLQACRGYWDYNAGVCRPKPVKNIGKKKPVMPGTSGGVGGGSTDCGPGYSYNPEKGCRKTKSIGKSKQLPATSGGVDGGGDAKAAASDPLESPRGGGGGGDGE